MGVLYNNFTAGELSRLVDGRTDLPGYYNGCRKVRGFVPLIQGGVTRAPGTKYIAETKDSGVARVERFVYSKTKAYVLELGAQYMRFYTDGDQIESAGSPYEISTPYAAADLFELVFVPSWDRMYIFHGDYAPRVLTRTSDTSWTLSTVDFGYGPFLTQNTSDITLTPSATTGNITLTASDDLFENDHVGALFQITHWVNESYYTDVFQGTFAVYGGTSVSLGYVKGSYEFKVGFLTNPWTPFVGTIKLQKSFDGSTWADIFVVTRAATDWTDTQVFQGEEEDDGVQYRTSITDYTSGFGIFDMRVEAHWHNGIVQITGVTSATLASATVILELGGTSATDKWAEGSWSGVRGYPAVGAFYEQRLWMGSTNHEPQTLWATRTFGQEGDYESMLIGTDDSDALVYTINSNEMNCMRWMVPSDFLLIGTEGDTWKVSATNEKDAVTPTNIAIRPQNSEGSALLQAIKIANAVVYCGRGKKKVYDLRLADIDIYEAEDLTRWAEHITDDGIVDWAYQAFPHPILWAVTDSGRLINLSYYRKDNVLGWGWRPFETGIGQDETISETSTTQTLRYPTLQPLTAAEIPSTPTLPTDTALSGAVSVTTPAGLRAMTPGHHYSIDADIDMTGEAWTPLDFDSTSNIVIEGNNKTISNLTLSSAGSNEIAFIASIDDTGACEIRNLTFSNCSMTGKDYVGILVGDIKPHNDNCRIKNVNFTNCTVTHGTAAGGSYMGILAGDVYGKENIYIANCTATNCTVTSTTNDSGYIGGMFGAIWNSGANSELLVSNCHVTGGTMTVTTDEADYIGGFAGICNMLISDTRAAKFYNCSSTMAIVYQATGATSTIIACGGFFGYVTNAYCVTCYATGNITCTTSGSGGSGEEIWGIGGFLGQSSCNETYINCYCTGTITCADAGDAPIINYIGGFAGYVDYDFQLLRCYSTSAIAIATEVGDPATPMCIGGFAARVYTQDVSSTFERCWSEGDISFAKDVGADTGWVGGFIGAITTRDSTYGLDVLNCYSWSSITCAGSYNANVTFCGFVCSWPDMADLTLVNAYTAQTDSVYGSGYTGQIPAGNDSHGFGGDDAVTTVTATALYWDTQTSSIAAESMGVGKTTTWLMTQSNFEAVNWDFDTIWTMPPLSETTTTSYTAEGLGPNSVTTIPGDPEDEVWLVVARVIDGEVKRYVEQQQPFDWGSSQRDCWFVDSAAKWDGGAAVNVTNVTVAQETGRVTVTANSHGFTDGWYVKFSSIAGATDLNGHTYIVADGATNSFTLKKTDSNYVDGTDFGTYTSGGTVERVALTMTGLDHLEGEELTILGDGRKLGTETVSSGAITIDEYCNTIIAGLAYLSELEPMWPESKYGAFGGTTIQGKAQKIANVVLRFYKSLGGKMGTDEDDAKDIEYYTHAQTLTKPMPILTGDTVTVIHPGGWEPVGKIHIETDDPYPMTVCSILYDLEASR